MYIILTNGTCVSFKTMFAQEISLELKIPLVASYYFGNSSTKDGKGINQIARKKRHELFFKKAEQYIS